MCSQLNNLIVPMVYRHVHLTSTSAESLFSNNVQKSQLEMSLTGALSAFTREITVESDAYISPSATLWSSLQNFRRLTLRYQNESHRGTTVNIEAVTYHWRLLFEALQHRFPLLTLSIDCRCNCRGEDVLLDLMPNPRLTSYRIQGSLTQSHAFHLQKGLVASPQLRILHLINLNGPVTRARGNPVSSSFFRFSEEGKLPPIEELLLEAYRWRHHPWTVNTVWDWSRLSRLTLHKTNTLQFLRSIYLKDLAGLERLELDGYCNKLSEASELIQPLVSLLEEITNLEALSLVCSLTELPPDAIHMHSSTLRELSIRDYSGIQDNKFSHLQKHRFSEEPVSTLRLADLENIRTDFPNLLELSLDLDQVEHVRPPTLNYYQY